MSARYGRNKRRRDREKLKELSIALPQADKAIEYWRDKFYDEKLKSIGINERLFIFETMGKEIGRVYGEKVKEIFEQLVTKDKISITEHPDRFNYNIIRVDIPPISMCVRQCSIKPIPYRSGQDG